jgi:hypothetical protein
MASEIRHVGRSTYDTGDVTPEMDGLEGLVAAQREEIAALAHLLGAVYPFVGFPYDPNKARQAWDEFGRLMVEVESTLALYPGAKQGDPDPGNVIEIPAWRRPRGGGRRTRTGELLSVDPTR